jgi:RNA polymerase sigma-70 factor (ECF subfamily)
MTSVLSEELRPVAAPCFADDDAIDAALAKSAQAGDLHAFSTLYDRHHPRLVRFCRSRLGDADDAADAAQETFLRAWRALDTFGNRGSFYPWLHTIARNVCTDALRTRSRFNTSDDRDLGTLPDKGATAVDLLDAESDNAVLRAALDRLSERHREILAMREYEGWTYERIADAEQLELNAVKSLVWRARQALRREFLELTADGRFGGLLGLGLLARTALPAARRSIDRIAAIASELTAVGSGGAAAAGAVTVAVAVAVGAGTGASAGASLPVGGAPQAVVQLVAMPSPFTPPAGAGATSPSSTATNDSPAATSSPTSTGGTTPSTVVFAPPLDAPHATVAEPGALAPAPTTTIPTGAVVTVATDAPKTLTIAAVKAAATDATDSTSKDAKPTGKDKRSTDDTARTTDDGNGKGAATKPEAGKPDTGKPDTGKPDTGKVDTSLDVAGAAHGNAGGNGAKADGNGSTNTNGNSKKK